MLQHHGSRIDRKLLLLLAIALGLRILRACTQATWAHPDEWFQTLEFGHWIAHHSISFTQEVALHMRNLSFPMLVAGIYRTVAFLDLDTARVRLFLPQLLVAVLDFFAMLAWIDILRRRAQVHQSKLYSHFPWYLALIFLLLPLFMAESARTSSEHLSTIALAFALWCMETRRATWAGVGCIAIFSFRYPSALFSLGLALAFLQKDHRRTIPQFLWGLAIGSIGFGLSDWWIYGRPWESFWMYLQYNLFTGLSHKNFGSQSSWIYVEIFQSRWLGLFLPLTLALIPGFFYRIYTGIRALEPATWAFLLYLSGHLAISHKEPRFVLPLEPALVFLALDGWQNLLAKNTQWIVVIKQKIPLRLLKLLVIFLSISTLLFSLHSSLGQLFRPYETYLEIDRHLQEHPETVAILTVRKPTSLLLPRQPSTRPGQLPSPALAYLPFERELNWKENMEKHPAVWISHRPTQIEQSPRPNPATILIHYHRPESFFDQHGCEILRSGVLRIAPKQFWHFFLQKKWVSGPWYSCPTTLLESWKNAPVRSILATTFFPIATLPPLGISASGLLELLSGQNINRLQDGTMGDLP